MIKVNIYDKNCKFLKQLKFSSLVLALEQMLSGNFYYCEIEK
jgi:hypothetical protein